MDLRYAAGNPNITTESFGNVSVCVLLMVVMAAPALLISWIYENVAMVTFREALLYIFDCNLFSKIVFIAAAGLILFSAVMCVMMECWKLLHRTDAGSRS